MEEFLQRIEEVNNLINSGVAHYKQGNYKAARRNYLEAYEIFRDSYKKGGSSKENSGNILSNLRREDLVKLADILSVLACHISTNNIDTLDDLVKAVDLYEEEIRIRERNNDIFGRRKAEQRLIDIYTRFRQEGENHLNDGLQNRERADTSAALENLKMAEEFYKNINLNFFSPDEQSSIKSSISRVYRELRNNYALWISQEYRPAQTIEWWQSAAKYFSKIQFEINQEEQDEKTKSQIVENLKSAANTTIDLLRKNNKKDNYNYKSEINLLKSLLKTMCMLENLFGEADVLIGLGNTFHSIGCYRDAESAYQQALGIYEKHDNAEGRIGKLNALVGLGKTYHSLGQYLAALQYLGENQNQQGDD